MRRTIFGSDGPTIDLPDALHPTGSHLEVGGEMGGGRSFEALGGRIDFGGAAQVRFDLLGEVDLGPAPAPGSRESLAPLGRFAPPANRRWGVLTLSGGASASGSGSGGGGVSIEIGGAAELGFRYRQVRAVPAGDRPATALLRSLPDARLPFSRDIESFTTGGHWHETTFDASLSVSAAVAAGKSLTLGSDETLLKGLLPPDAPEVVARIDVLVRASLGLELADSLRIGAGRLPAETKGWVRYRLERSRRRSVSFGASLALDLWYNKRVLTRILDAALVRVGYPQVQEKLLAIAREIDPDDLTLEGLRERLEGELFELAKDVLPIDEATGAIAERASGLLAFLGRVERRYQQLDGAFRGLVDHLLGSVGLAPGGGLREALEELAALGGRSPQELAAKVGEGLGDLEPLVDLLARRSLDELLLGGAGELKREIDRLADQAEKLLGLVEEVDGSDLTDVIEKATGSGIVRKVVQFLHDAPDGVDAFRHRLEEEADAELEGLIARLVGGALDRMDQRKLRKRLRRLREWAERVDGALTDAASVDRRLRDEIEALHDRLGFVVSFTIDRTTRRATLVDIELDPRNAACRDAFAALADGDVVRFTELLPFETGKDRGEAAEDPPFRFHHFVLASDRSTTLSWVFAPLWGEGRKISSKAFDSARIEITGSGGRLERTGTYSGGLVQTVGAGREGALRSWMGSIWLTSTGTAGTPAITEPYARARHSLHLSTLRFDDDLAGDRRRQLDRLLHGLGFGSREVSSRVPHEATAVRIEARLVLEGPADQAPDDDPVAHLLGPLDKPPAEIGESAELDAVFLTAAASWLSDPLASDEHVEEIPLSDLLPLAVTGRQYRDLWRKGLGDDRWRRPLRVPSGQPPVELRMTPAARGAWPAFILFSIAAHRTWSRKILSRLGAAWRDAEPAGGAVPPADLVALSRRFRRAARKVAPPLEQWGSPLFPHRLVFARLQSGAPGDLAALRGVASIGWRRGTDDWQPRERIVRGG